MDEAECDDWVLVRRPTEAEIMASSGGEWTGFTDERPPLKVVFEAPAKYWTDASPIGNGSLGAMVWGSVPTETIQLNHDTLWTGKPGNFTNPEAPGILSKVRKLVDDGKYAEATSLAYGLSDRSPDAYQQLGDIKLEFDESHGTYTAYQRELDLDTAVVKVKYALGDVDYTRESFSSYPHQVIVTKISASKMGSLSFTVSLDSKLHHHSSVNGENQIILEGRKSSSDPKGIKFSAILDLQISGDSGLVQVQDGRKLRVENSSWAVLLLVASSSFDGPFANPSSSRKDLTAALIGTMSVVKKNSFAQLFANHLNDYQELFHRVILRLPNSSKSGSRGNISSFSKRNPFDVHLDGNIGLPPVNMTSASFFDDALISTAERVKSFRSDEDPSLVELLFQYGRYLLISCSRPGTQAANLQGIWSKDLEPPWDAAPHLNINLQMNYWPSLSCNLSECQEPLFDYISSLAINGAKTANSDIWAKTSPDNGDPVWALWPMGGAWICTHLWEHYTFSMDKAFLQNRAYPLLQGCASFLLDWMIEGQGGFLETNPSTSPEHPFIAPDGKTASVSYSSTMDIAITKEVFSAVISASEVLGRTEDDFIQKVRKALSRLPPTRIARDGSIMEWAQDFQDPEVHHRHLSHLFGLFPGHTITMEKNPDLCRAADYTLYKRGDEGPGWSTTWKMALWAHLHNSGHAYKMVLQLINLIDPEHESSYEGGSTATCSPPTRPSRSTGTSGIFTAGVAEMLAQSTETDLHLLPALPRDKWASGSVQGLKARGGVTVNISWKEGELHEARLWSKTQTVVKNLHYRGTVVSAELTRGYVFTFDGRLRCLRALPPLASSVRILLLIIYFLSFFLSFSLLADGADLRRAMILLY
ncbi:unnamed protein product [Spirodela intermedia]|uniref:Uncharacterized protein n=1 Tax=Spirodela intermedia TaxID=51605 RepID=A0A7I8IJ04_SPIIN|nr:unnamed protein product [Spirodela intermedia]CAA6657470.1 unnamed protein product [Spirodela intermedia]